MSKLQMGIDISIFIYYTYCNFDATSIIGRKIMSKKGFIGSLVLSVLVALSLSIYTLVSIFYVPGKDTPKPYEPTNTTTQYAFRSGDEVGILDGYSTSDGTLTFVIEEGNEDVVVLNEETGKYIAANKHGTVKAIIKLNDKGDTNTYIINVYPHSDAGATEDAPFIIANKANLKEFAAIMNETGEERRTEEKGNQILFAEVVADIDLAGENWIPMGNTSYMVENLTFKGNGHKIKNMTINVNTENYEQYIAVESGKGSMNIAFFGSVYKTKIFDLNFENAVINVANGVYDIIASSTIPDGATYTSFDVVNVGVVTARMSAGSVVSGTENNMSVSAKINAFSYVNTGNAEPATVDGAYNSGLGGVVGFVYHGQVKNCDVNLSVVNNISTVYNSNIGGIVGRMHATIASADLIKSDSYKNTISGCNVTMKVTSVYNNISKIAGIVATAVNTDIKDCVVEGFTVIDNTDLVNINQTVEDNKITSVNGVVHSINSVELRDAVKGDLSEEEFAALKEVYDSHVSNVVVKNVNVSMRGGVASGFAQFISVSKEVSDASTYTYRDVIITDSTVQGAIYAREAFGFAKEIFANVKISYTKAEVVIDVRLTGVVATGFGGFVYGNIHGVVDESGNKTEIIADIRGLGALLSAEQAGNYALRKQAYDNTFIAGFAGNIYANNVDLTVLDLENEDDAAKAYNAFNLKLNVNLYNSLNMAGVAYNIVDGRIARLDVDATITSYNYNKADKNYSTTYMVAGVACKIGSSAEMAAIAEINVNLNVNQDVDKNLAYGATFFGGIVARIMDNNVYICGNKVTGNVYFNDTYYTAVSDDVEYKAFVAGGIVGSITSYGANAYDAFDKVSTDQVYIMGNDINGLSITFDRVYDKMEKDGFRVRAIGVLVGNYYSDDALDLSIENTFEDVTITADVDTFTYGYRTIDGWTKIRTTFGYNTESETFEYSYGISSDLNAVGGVVTDVAAEMLANITFLQRNETAA